MNSISFTFTSDRIISFTASRQARTFSEITGIITFCKG